MLFALKMLGYQKFECWIILCVTILQLQRYEQIHKFQQTRTRIGKSVMLWDAKKIKNPASMRNIDKKKNSMYN